MPTSLTLAALSGNSVRPSLDAAASLGLLRLEKRLLCQSCAVLGNCYGSVHQARGGIEAMVMESGHKAQGVGNYSESFTGGKDIGGC